MANVKIRLWGQPAEVAEAVRRLGTVLRVVQESSVREGRRDSGEVWQYLMITLPESHQRSEPLSLFAALFCQECTFPDTWESIVANLTADPLVQVLFREIASTPVGRAIMRSQRTAWAMRGQRPPWEHTLGPIDREG